MKKILLISFFTSIYFFIFYSRVVSSFTYFEDNFNYLDSTKWFYYINDGTIFFDGNGINLDGSITIQTKFPYFFTKTISIPRQGDFEINFKINKTSLNAYGTGIAFAKQIPHNGNLADRYLEPERYIEEQFINVVYGEGNNGLLVTFSGDCFIPIDFSCFQDVNIPNPPVNLLFKIIYSSKKYKIYLNDDLLIESAFETMDRPTDIWFGSPFFGNNPATWVPFKMRYINIKSYLDLHTPIIFLPGYMASFQWEDLRDNTSTHNWERNPVEKVYNNFFDTLKNLGYQEGLDLVRYDYDFRQPLPEISQKFTSFLNNFLSSWPQGTKVILIGHSFGGLLAKQYIHDNSGSNVLNVVTVGTPHEGVLDVYPLLAAGEMTDADIWQKAAFETISIFNGKNFLNNREIVENIIPSAHDLLPIFDDYYLKNSGGDTISSSLNNPNLAILKNILSPEIFKIVRGTNKNTKRFYVLENRSIIDQALGNYPDGRIKQTEFSSAGDGTVLTKSANISGVNAEDLADQNHVQIISTQNGIKKVLDSAGISYTDDKIVENPVPSIPQALLFLLQSPAELKVTDTQTGKSAGANATNPIENAVSEENNKFVFVPTVDGKNYHVEVIGAGNGKYKLDISAISTATASSHISFYKDIKNNETDLFEIKYREKANLISLAGNQLINPYLSLKTTLADLNEFISTSSASLQLKDTTKVGIDDLLADADLINKLSENKITQAILLNQKMLLKAFLLNKNLNSLNSEEKIQTMNKVLALAQAEKELFVTLNNKTAFAAHDQTSASLDNLALIKHKVNGQLQQKLLSGEADEFNAANYTNAENISNFASREFSSLLYAQAFFSGQISRHLLNAALE